MYEAFFNLQTRPFPAAPQPDRYFPGRTIEAARLALSRCIERAEGAGLVSGPSGTGKTLLCQVLAREFHDRFAMAQLAGGRLGTRQALLQAILFELGLPYRGLDEGELRLSLFDYLSPSETDCEGLLLLVDEAHTLPLRLLDELRMITNLVRDGQPRVRLVLAGSLLLEERFAHPRLDSFSQRLTARCYLESFEQAETCDYVKFQISAAGGDPLRVFQDEALRHIHRATNGVPRLINQVCNHAMILATVNRIAPVSPGLIDEAWADLQQLPTPWGESKQSASDSKVVEFGGLDETGDEQPTAIPFRPSGSRTFDTLEPEVKLDRIEEQLAAIEVDFGTLRTNGPEVELTFPEMGNPFNESFDEEEVVLDRFASQDIDLFGDMPPVTSNEGRQLAAMLEPFVRRDVAALTIASTPEPPSGQRAAAGNTLLRGRAPIVGGIQMASFGIDATASSVLAAETPRSEALNINVQAQPAGAVATRSEKPNETTAEEDDDVIVIEDEGSDGLTPSLWPRVRRQEYRQLFAKLRRG